jgi:hypothetical protein
MILSVLLAFTLVTCIVLERRLSALRKGQDGIRKTFDDLNTAITAAAGSIRALKSAAGEAAEALDARLSRARALADELALITASGERIAERFDRAPAARTTVPLPSGSVMSRLDSLRAVR